MAAAETVLDAAVREIVALKGRVQVLEHQKNEMVEQIVKLGAGEATTSRYRQNLLQRKTLEKHIPTKLQGKEEAKEMNYFVFGLKRMVEDDSGFIEFLEWIENQEDDITEDMVQAYDDEHHTTDAKWMNNELYNVLVGMSAPGPTKDRQMNLDHQKTVRGALGYYMLTCVGAGNPSNS